jgi:hypothetical protein
MKYKLLIKDIEEYFMGGTYTGTCIANDEHGEKYFVCNMAMDIIYEYADNIFVIPILLTREINEDTQIIHQKCVRIAKVDMTNKKLTCYQKYFDGMPQFSSIDNLLNISLSKYNRQIQLFEFDLLNEAIAYSSDITDKMYTKYIEQGHDKNTFWYCEYNIDGVLLKQINETDNEANQYWDIESHTTPLQMPKLDQDKVYTIYAEDFEGLWPGDA